MKNPNGSDIPLVRSIIETVLSGAWGQISPRIYAELQYALTKTHRADAVRRADTQQKTPITAAMKAQIMALKGDTSKSNSDIAVAVGLPRCASGRVTEVFQGLR